MIIPHNPKEIIAVVDDNDNIIGKTNREDVHINGKLHREASVLIVNSRNEILLQERADNRKLDYSASGHFPLKENYLEGAVRDVNEELGLIIDKRNFIKIAKFRINYSGRHVNNRFVTLFEVKGDYEINDFFIDTKEVGSVNYFSISELKKIMKQIPQRMGKGLAESLKIYFRLRKF